MRLIHLTAAAAFLLLAPQIAQAGPRPYAYVQGVDSLSESTLELENWFGVRHMRTGREVWDWWLGPVAGITDQLEVGLFAIFTQPIAADDAPKEPLALDSLRLQVSYLLAEKAAWPIDVRVRAEIGQPISGNGYSGWLSVIASRDQGPLNLTLNAGSWAAYRDDKVALYFDGSAAASVETFDGLRLGGELVGGVELGKPFRLSAGPSLAYGIGRIWLSSNLGFGLTEDSAKVRGRLVFGVLF